ncbi:HD domain-containing protein [Bacillus spizizenii]|nr:HD domain-containing protein [Bacillus spizizenii]MEC0841960.1 HD domain-containing protein [Bacillus spizizenii]
MEHQKSSRVRHLEQSLSTLGYYTSLKALDLVMDEMNAERGFVRHSGAHYYYHLVDVAQKLLNFGVRDEDTITAALLHDIVEDVDDYTPGLIAKFFNPRVALYVELLSKKPGVDYKDGTNLIPYLEEISNYCATALIKTADRIHNFGTLLEATPEKKLRQALETEKHFIPFFKKCRDMYPRYSSFFFEAKTQIEPHLWEIKEHYEEVSALQSEINKLKEALVQK